jgi:tetratricopeptide (TPR) repeat protein
MLKKYPNYKPILLVIWKWYYELWDTLKAKEYLIQYFDIDQTNLNVAYLLWDINFKLRDYTTSNIYYNNALQNWHLDRIDLERKLIYNYYLLWDKRWMLKIFSYLVDENESTINDFSLWIYHAILNARLEDAVKWANIWLRKFANKNWYEVFYWYLWWMEREAWNLDIAEQYITKWLKINPRNPLLTLNYWYLEEARWTFEKALIYFKRTQVINWDGEFWELAQREIKQIEDFFKKNLEK